MTYQGILKRGSKGPAVKALQARLNALAKKRVVVVDGEFGPATERAVRGYQGRHGLLPDGVVGPQTWAALQGKAAPPAVKLAGLPLRERAYRIAMTLVGVMESGANNHGPMVDRIIREAGFLPGIPWCGAGVFYCYNHAGSLAVRGQAGKWVYVPAMRSILGVKPIATPQRGDIVRFEFTGDSTPDHTGLFIRDLGGGTIETWEANTGARGAVSDSRTGGDGVYIKRRSKQLVKDYLRVTK